MSLDARQFRDYVVRPALLRLVAWSVAAEQLVLGTAAQESRLTYLHQLGGGPALGLFQMEPATVRDHFGWLRFHSTLNAAVRSMVSAEQAKKEFPDPAEIGWNLRLAAALCRVHYLRHSFPLPVAGDVAGFARAWKLTYNTPQGAGTEEEFMRNYRLVEDV